MLIERTGGRVAGGPFAGMRYTAAPSEGSFFPKLAGTYEQELAGVIESICATPYATIVNVGSAEGYYAVGLARRIPGATVHAIDVDDAARQACAELARENGVGERVRTSEFLSDAMLMNGPTLAVVDCEGCERTTLDPARFARLTVTDLLVETHEFLDSQVHAVLEARFAATHDIQTIAAQPRSPEAVGVLEGLSKRERALATDEMRPPGMRWMWMRVRRR